MCPKIPVSSFIITPKYGHAHTYIMSDDWSAWSFLFLYCVEYIRYLYKYIYIILVQRFSIAVDSLITFLGCHVMTFTFVCVPESC